MFQKLKMTMIGILAAIFVIAIGAGTYNAYASQAINETSGVGRDADHSLILTANPSSNLSAEEAAGLLFMREEEKLARDLYNQLFSTWGQRVFQNIGASEQTHMDQIKLLMDRYALTDHALGPGQFTDANLQKLYDQLVAQGSISLEEAFKVGALVEQTDIADLQSRLAQTDNTDIQLVYKNLMNASYNHLNAFTGGAGQGGAGQGYGRRGGNGNRHGRP